MSRHCIICGKELQWHQVVGIDFCEACLYPKKRRDYLNNNIKKCCGDTKDYVL